MDERTSVRQIRVGKVIGLSAYELAVKHGAFSGTEEEFASQMKDNTADITNLNEELIRVKSRLDDLEYKPITIISFTNNLNTVEVSVSSKTATLTWSLSKDPKTLKIDNSVISGATAKGSTTKTINGSFIGSTKYTLSVTDAKNNTVSSTTTVNVFNRIYYGAAELPGSLNDSFVKGLAKSELSNSKGRSISLTALAGQYYFYCIPTRLGSCKFAVGGFSGGFDKVATIPVTNSSGYQETYDVYRSNNANLGTNTIVIS